MGIIPKFTANDVHQAIAERMEWIEKAIIFRLNYLGEQCVTRAREEGSYINRTGNLRNSVGYIVVANGTIVNSNFTSTSKSKGGEDGAQAGRNVAEEYARSFTTGYALIVVAGMNYAVYVESKNYDVLTTAELFAREELPKILTQLATKIGKMN